MVGLTHLWDICSISRVARTTQSTLMCHLYTLRTLSTSEAARERHSTKTLEAAPLGTRQKHMKNHKERYSHRATWHATKARNKDMRLTLSHNREHAYEMTKRTAYYAADYLEFIRSNTELERLNAIDLETGINPTGVTSVAELQARGMAVKELKIDPTYHRLVDLGYVEIRLTSDTPLCDLVVTKDFRAGKNVDIILGWFDHFKLDSLDKWRIVSGVIHRVKEEYILVRVPSISNFIVEALNTIGDDEAEKTKVMLIRKSEVWLIEKQLGHLVRSGKDIFKTPQTGTISPAMTTVLSDLYGGNTTPNDTATGDDKRDYQEITLFNPHLDTSQQHAVQHCLQNEPVSIIHGPPGTGKTTTLAASILSYVARGARVLVVAPSNAACDAIAAAVLKHWPNVADGSQTGFDVRTMSNTDTSVRQNDVATDDDVWRHPRFGSVVRIGAEIWLTLPDLKTLLPHNILVSGKENLVETQRKLTRVRHELLDKSRRNIKKGDLLGTEKLLVQELRSQKRDLESRVIAEARIVIATNARACDRELCSLLASGHFDLLCVDEAGFATDTSVFPLIMSARKVILSGDHLQLPPVIRSAVALKNGFDKTVLERMSLLTPERVSMLRVQYRSNRIISEWSSHFFYNNQLMAHPSVANSVLADFPGVVRHHLWTTWPLIFIDTCGQSFYEESDPYSGGVCQDSFANFDEVFLVEALVLKYINLGVRPEAIGVISPYWGQVKLLQDVVWSHASLRNVDIRSVDGFQGREKEMIILSFVRSNPNGEVGFLDETRRINVSVTRGKRCCVIVGDSETLSSDQGLESLIAYCKAKGAHVFSSDVIQNGTVIC